MGIWKVAGEVNKACPRLMKTRLTDIKTFRDLQVYQAGFAFQQAIFHASKSWPREETYSLIDQVRRSSRSIGGNIAESWAKRRYPAHFLSKLTDADGELQETEHWIETAIACGYVRDEESRLWLPTLDQIGRMLGSMMAKHEKFCLR
jgi:four helix bundle protein